MQVYIYIYCIHIAVCGFTTCTWYYDTWPIIMIFFDLNYIGIRHVDAYIHSCWFALCIYVNMYLCIDIVEAVFQPVYFKVFIHSTYHRITYDHICIYIYVCKYIHICIMIHKCRCTMLFCIGNTRVIPQQTSPTQQGNNHIPTPDPGPFTRP